MERKLLKITDNDGLIQEGKKLFKVHRYGRGHNIHYIEINPKEYDERIDTLAKTISKFPNVDLITVLKDALYDLPLKRLEIVEERIRKEVEKASKEKRPPEVKTKTANRGTCVDLAIGKRFLLNIRA